MYVALSMTQSLHSDLLVQDFGLIMLCRIDGQTGCYFSREPYNDESQNAGVRERL